MSMSSHLYLIFICVMAILEMESTLSARAGVDNLQFEFLVMLHNIDSIRSGMCKQRYLIKFVLLSKI